MIQFCFHFVCFSGKHCQKKPSRRNHNIEKLAMSLSTLEFIFKHRRRQRYELLSRSHSLEALKQNQLSKYSCSVEYSMYSNSCLHNRRYPCVDICYHMPSANSSGSKSYQKLNLVLTRKITQIQQSVLSPEILTPISSVLFVVFSKNTSFRCHVTVSLSHYNVMLTHSSPTYSSEI